MAYELPDFPVGIVYKTPTTIGTIDHKKFESKETLMEHLNTLRGTSSEVDITVYKMSTEIDPVTNKDKVVCRYHNIPKN